MPFELRPLSTLPYPHAMARRTTYERGVSECPYSRDAIKGLLPRGVEPTDETMAAAYAREDLRERANRLCPMHRGDIHRAQAAALALLDRFGWNDPEVADRFPDLPQWLELDETDRRLARWLLAPDDLVRLHTNSSGSSIIGQHRTCFARAAGAESVLVWIRPGQQLR
ncbi:hypothetical protein AXK58_24290 [Tsukamurella tyrosinosolvens]|uniref:Uncharacterized protein n=1 Tax=Tsukamurella tyrosinosolvens TaxID=57704 RepID=A0A1H4UNH8_TSUTY|nr:hypothetical protein [Tsukamurella tyrosinosolvens]KXO99077.1 hypothetical protein AXK58_24290 [Tsukamurella tyrosinosolvens]SEC70299.1 hypothetical protein SAMN04489793_2962 [Tsukamurella tyrosinosolvens]